MLRLAVPTPLQVYETYVVSYFYVNPENIPEDTIYPLENGDAICFETGRKSVGIAVLWNPIKYCGERQNGSMCLLWADFPYTHNKEINCDPQILIDHKVVGVWKVFKKPPPPWFFHILGGELDA